MESGAVRPIRYWLVSFVVLLIAALLIAVSWIPFSSTSPLLVSLGRGFPPEVAAARCERLKLASLVTGLLLLAVAVLLWLGRHWLPARWSRFAERFRASARAFGADLRGLLQRVAADRRGLLWLALLTLAGIVVRIWFLDQPMRYDEAHTYLAYVQPRNLRLFYYPVPNNHVAHTLLVYLSTALLGDGPWAIRLPAFLAGVLLIPATYLCARTVFDRSAGLVAAGLVAGSPSLVLYSTNARGYSGIALLTAALVPLTLYLVRKESVFAGLLVALLAAVGLYTVPIMLFPLAMLAVWSLLLAYHYGGRARTLRLACLGGWVLLLCAAMTALLYTPVVIMSGLSSVVANRAVLPVPVGQVVQSWPGMASEAWLRLGRDIPVACQVILGVGLLAGAVHTWRTKRPAFLLIPAAVIGSGALLLALRVVPPTRTWLFFVPLGFCLADAGITGLMRVLSRDTRVLVAGALGSLFAVGITWHLVSTDAVASYPETGATIPDAEAIGLSLQAHLREGDRILATRNLPLRYYASRLGIPLEAFGEGGAGEVYVVVRLPKETFHKVTAVFDLQLDEGDYAVEAFPSALLYLPRGVGG
jgi:hypothetical protein